jgi:hypothetical protein
MPQDTAQTPDSLVVSPVAAPLPFVPAGFRELRAQAVQRLQVGLFGLAAMLLLVGLANIIMDRARLADSENPSPTAAIGSGAPDEAGSDPLADIGVVPAAEPSQGAAAGNR